MVNRGDTCWQAALRASLPRRSLRHSTSLRFDPSPVKGVRVACQPAKCGVRCRTSRTEGVGGLFKGNMSNCISSAPGKAIDFFAYAAYKGLLTGNDREPTNLERLLAGSLAGMTSDSILYPLEVVSTRVTMNMSKTGATNIAQAMVEIAKKEGIRGLYSGWGAAMVGVVPYAGISFGCYDILSAQYRKFARVDSAVLFQRSELDSFQVFWPPPSRFHSTAPRSSCRPELWCPDWWASRT